MRIKNIFFTIIIVFISNYSFGQPQLVPLGNNPAIENAIQKENKLNKTIPDIENIPISEIVNFDNNGFCEIDITQYEELFSSRNKIIYSPDLTQIKLGEKIYISTNSGKDSRIIFIDEKTGNTRSIQLRNKRAVTLPFIEDFAYKGPFPRADKWLDKDVFVNGTLGPNPVSIGIASFDGIGPDGLPYNKSQGPSDTLTSETMDIRAADRNNLYITFYLQAGGLSFAPEEQDSIILQFKDDTDGWKSIRRFVVDDFPNRDSFYFVFENIPSSFFHDAFQFRFINYSDNQGMTDVWNLDYIKVDEELGSNFQRETDLAMTFRPDPLLERYRAMPWKHFRNFESQELKTTYNVQLYNHNDQILQADSSTLTIFADNGTAPLPFETLLEVPPIVPENQRDLSPGRHNFTNDIKTTTYVSRFHDLYNDDEECIVFRKAYIYKQIPNSVPALRLNNLAIDRTEFNNYFAYDDGSAESGIQFNFGGTSPPALATRFYTNVGDSVKGIQAMFIHVEQADQNQVFQFLIWGPDLNAPPIYQSGPINPVFVNDYIETDSIQGISTFKLRSIYTGEDTSVYIREGFFYAGWRQISSGNRGVIFGFDLNSSNSSKENYYFNGASWANLDSISPLFQGVPILRPIMTSSKNIIPTPIDEPEWATEDWSIFPNPASNSISIRWADNIPENSKYQIFNSAGQLIQDGRLEHEIDIKNIPPGTYWVRIFSGLGIGSTKQLMINR